jgi:hypothetical protein
MASIGEHGKLAACAVVEGSGNKLGQPLLLSGVKHRIRGCSGADVPVEASRVFRFASSGRVLARSGAFRCSGRFPVGFVFSIARSRHAQCAS